MKLKPANIQVRFRDCDVMGHVNNAVYLSYFEQARMYYFQQMVGSEWDWKKNGVILVKNEVIYLHPIFLQDKPEIFVFLKSIGSKSFTLSYRIMVEGKLVSTGESKLVCFDFIEQRTVEVSLEMRKGLEKLEIVYEDE
jgi:acyl-CoA thioester hydrolase